MYFYVYMILPPTVDHWNVLCARSICTVTLCVKQQCLMSVSSTSAHGVNSLLKGCIGGSLKKGVTHMSSCIVDVDKHSAKNVLTVVFVARLRYKSTYC